MPPVDVPGRKPVRRALTVVYWECRDPEHRHRTEQVAMRCILRSGPRRVCNQWSDEAYDDLLAKFDAGATPKELAVLIGVGVSRISQVLRTARHRKKWKADRMSCQALGLTEGSKEWRRHMRTLSS